jgi:hypothetical protein
LHGYKEQRIDEKVSERNRNIRRHSDDYRLHPEPFLRSEVCTLDMRLRFADLALPSGLQGFTLGRIQPRQQTKPVHDDSMHHPALVHNTLQQMTIEEAQETIDRLIKEYGVRYFSELTNMAVLTEEVGELARVISRR